MKDEALKLALEALETLMIERGSIYDKAITAIKEALAQSEQETPKGWKSEIWKSVKQQEQESVTWGVDWGKAGDIPCVSIIKRVPNGSIEVMAVEYAPYSYTTPPQRKPLTENEIKHLWYEACQTNLELTSQLIVHLARNIEAAHGIKGEA